MFSIEESLFVYFSSSLSAFEQSFCPGIMRPTTFADNYLFYGLFGLANFLDLDCCLD